MEQNYKWAAKGDLNAFFALMLDKQNQTERIFMQRIFSELGVPIF